MHLDAVVTVVIVALLLSNIDRSETSEAFFGPFLVGMCFHDCDSAVLACDCDCVDVLAAVPPSCFFSHVISPSGCVYANTNWQRFEYVVYDILRVPSMSLRDCSRVAGMRWVRVPRCFRKPAHHSDIRLRVGCDQQKNRLLYVSSRRC